MARPPVKSPYRSTASGLHDISFLVYENNAAKGSRHTSCVPLEEAMAPEIGLIVTVRVCALGVGSELANASWVGNLLGGPSSALTEF